MGDFQLRVSVINFQVVRCATIDTGLPSKVLRAAMSNPAPLELPLDVRVLVRHDWILEKVPPQRANHLLEVVPYVQSELLFLSSTATTE